MSIRKIIIIKKKKSIEMKNAVLRAERQASSNTKKNEEKTKYLLVAIGDRFSWRQKEGWGPMEKMVCNSS